MLGAAGNYGDAQGHASLWSVLSVRGPTVSEVVSR
jgi:hypothetical protein